MTAYSVLMSVYYKEKAEYLVDAIESMINQTIPPNDFVLVCDGPLTTELDEVIETYKNKYSSIFQIVRLSENKGLGLALAEGLLYCKNEIVARMDSDDISVLNRMEIQLPVINSNENISVVGGNIAEFVNDISNIICYRNVPCAFEDIRTTLEFKNPMNHVTTIFRKSHVIAAGNYQTLIGYEDYFLWARLLSQNNKLINIDMVLCYVRVDDAMYMRRGGLNYFLNAKVLQKHMYKLGLITKLQYIRNIFIRFVSSVLLPNKLRVCLYKRLLRINN